jgi:hypothetical protein
MNQAIEQAIIDHTNKVWEQALKVGMADERERIIKLLDDWKCGHPDCDGDKTEVCYPKHYLIQLIKGEK